MLVHGTRVLPSGFVCGELAPRLQWAMLPEEEKEFYKLRPANKTDHLCYALGMHTKASALLRTSHGKYYSHEHLPYLLLVGVFLSWPVLR